MAKERVIAKKKFTVVLRYPDYHVRDWPNSMAIVQVTATHAADAVTKAQIRAKRVTADIHDTSDFAEVIVFHGWPRRA